MATATQNIITDPAEAMRVYDHVESVAFDIETGGLNCARDPIHVISLAYPGLPPVVLHRPWNPDPLLIKWLEKKVLVGHNLSSFDVPFMVKYGFDIFASKGWIDTLTAEQMAIVSDRRSVRKDLGSTLKRRLGVVVNKKIDHTTWRLPTLTPEQLTYALGDVVHIHKMYLKQLAVIKELGVEEGWKLERAIAPVVANMVARGLPLDDERRIAVIMELHTRLQQLSTDLRAAIGTAEFNAPQQLITGINNAYGVKLKSTNAETLLNLKMQPGELGRIAQIIDEGRQTKKRLMYDDNWVSKYVFNGRINSTYWQLGTDTSRFSSSDPNLQQWPRNLRTIIGFPDGDQRILKIDYSQLEIVVAAVLMREERLLEAALTGDVHSYVGSLIYNIPLDQITKELRRGAKAASFTLLFAGGAHSLIGAARDQGYEMDTAAANEAIYHFFQGLPNAYAYISRMRNIASNARHGGYSVPLQIPMGPRRSLSGQTVTPSQLVNTLVQGSAASGLKASMRRLKAAGVAQHLIGTVHDELIFQCHVNEVDELTEVAIRCMKEGMREVIGIEPNVEPAADLHWQ